MKRALVVVTAAAYLAGTSLRGHAPSPFIGEPNSRYRRPASVARAVEPIMLSTRSSPRDR